SGQRRIFYIPNPRRDGSVDDAAPMFFEDERHPPMHSRATSGQPAISLKEKNTMKKTRGDFSADERLIQLSVISIAIGALGAVVAVVLLKLIAWFTNLFFYLEFSFTPRTPAGSTLGLWIIVVPVIGGLIIGLIARYGSEKIRGHGI